MEASASPGNLDIYRKVKNERAELDKWHEIDEDIMRQKSKITWIKKGDGNNAYFFANVKERNRINALYKLTSLEGSLLNTEEEIEQEIVNFYKNLLGSAARRLDSVDLDTIRNGSQLSQSQKLELIKPVSRDEIYSALKEMNDVKAPGIDDFNSKFFKAAWSIVKEDVCNGIEEFFETGQMLKAINCTLITLIPKSPDASTVKEYRPIACCTTLYKIISKVLTKRMSKVLTTIISESQSAFVPGKAIQDNIMLAHELIRGYNRKGIFPKKYGKN